MDLIQLLKDDLGKGYSKSDLELLIGLPKNSLSGIVKGDKKISKISELKIGKWNDSEKPSPLQVVEAKRQMVLVKIKTEFSPVSGWNATELINPITTENKASILDMRNNIPEKLMGERIITPDFESINQDELSDYAKKTITDRIEQLQKELKNIPAHLKIPKKMYISIRETELVKLKKEIEKQLQSKK